MRAPVWRRSVGISAAILAGSPWHASGRRGCCTWRAAPARRLEQLSATPTVAIVGSRGATDYGMEMARDLARGLSASGVTVAGSLADGIAVAAQEGALEAGGKTLAVLDGGLDVACPARRRALHKRLLATGCVVAELPCGCGPRNWCYSARERTVVGLAQLTIVVEADERSR